MSGVLAVTMYMDKATYEKYFTGAAWGIDNNDFDGYVVPFAPQSGGELVALKKFARAYSTWHVKGPPVYLLTIKIPANDAVQHFLAHDLKVLDNRPEATVGFTRTVNIHNYPTMKAEVIKIDVPGGPDRLLRSGYDLLHNNA